MRELVYTVLELEQWNRNSTCDFCFTTFRNSDNKAVNQITTRLKLSGKLISNDCVCGSCKEKFENDELPKCSRCGRLQTRTDVDIHSGKYVCYCIRNNENLEEKELPSIPYESQTVFYERQINTLQEEKNQLTEEIDTHLEALEISEVWNKRQKQELLDKIAKLEEENKRLKEENKKLVPEELVQKVENYEKEITELKEQLKQVNKQQTTQIEVPPKENKIKNFFKFGSK